MSYIVIPGRFWITGKRPDGDTLSFEPNDKYVWLEKDWLSQNNNRIPDSNQKNMIDIRFEGIDALELHYRGKPWLPEYSQPMEYALKARDYMLKEIGYNEIEWDGLIAKNTNDGLVGYVITKSIDVYGRVIAFVYSGMPPADIVNKKGFYLTNELLQSSINYKLLLNGLVYPAFYSSLYTSIRSELTNACKIARKSSDSNIWGIDSSSTDTVLENISDITEKYVIMPKLFRRLIAHYSQNGKLQNFNKYMDENKDYVVNIQKVEYNTFNRFIYTDSKKNTMKLKILPEEFCFIDK